MGFSMRMLLLPVLMIFPAVFGCAGMKTAAPPRATVPGSSGQFKIGQIIDLRTGNAFSFEQLIDRIASKELIFIGEVHDNPEHHLIQVQILQALIACCGPLSVAMEFFQKPQQPEIDRYLRGELTESEFLRQVNWSRGWGSDFHLYRPLMLLAKQHSCRILAINAPDDVVKRVARYGLRSLEPTERNMLAQEIDLTNEAHRTYLLEVYRHHGHRELKEFDYFYEAQCVWEDTMAQNLSGYLRENQQRVVVFTGNGHIVNRFGIPERTMRRYPASMVTIMPFALTENVVFDKETADYVWLTAACPPRIKRFQYRR